MPVDEDIIFEELLADKRHREIKKSLSEIASSLSKIDNKEVVAAIEEQTGKIENFVDYIKNVPPDKDVDLTNLQAAADSILSEQKATNKLLSELLERDKRMREWEFRFSWQANGRVDSPIIAKQIK